MCLAYNSDPSGGTWGTPRARRKLLKGNKLYWQALRFTRDHTSKNKVEDQLKKFSNSYVGCQHIHACTHTHEKDRESIGKWVVFGHFLNEPETCFTCSELIQLMKKLPRLSPASFVLSRMHNPAKWGI